MATLRFSRDFTHRLTIDRAKTWPVGWAGEIGDEEIAFTAIRADAATFAGADKDNDELEAHYADWLAEKEKAEKKAAKKGGELAL